MLVALVVPLGAIASIEALFAPRAELWQRWTAHDPAAAAIDHAPWDRFAKTYVKPQPDGVNRVAYARVSAADRKALADYVAGLAGVPISAYHRDQQLAYWLNLYNALTVKLVLDHYPVASIRDIDISPGWFSNGPWNKKLVTIEGEAVSLNDIEHRILRPIWRDARIHYAVNCAAVGCPHLKPEAFTADYRGAAERGGARVRQPPARRAHRERPPRRLEHLRVVLGGLRRQRRGRDRAPQALRRARRLGRACRGRADRRLRLRLEPQRRAGAVERAVACAAGL